MKQAHMIMKRFAIAALTLAVCLAPAFHPAWAADDGDDGYVDEDNGTKYNMELERFKMPVSASRLKNAASNVAFGEVPFKKIPPELGEQITHYAKECFATDNAIDKMKFYRYVSDHNRDKGLPANYIVDTRELFGVPPKTCIIGNICEKEGCYTLGFQATSDDSWELQKSIRSFSWTVQLAKEPKREDPILYFVFATKEECKSDPKQEGCLMTYTWSPRGFASYTVPPQPVEPAVQAEPAAPVPETPTEDVNEAASP